MIMRQILDPLKSKASCPLEELSQIEKRLNLIKEAMGESFDLCHEELLIILSSQMKQYENN